MLQRPNPKKNMVYGVPYVGSDYNLTLCPFQSQLQHIYQEKPYAESTFARVVFIPQSGTLDLASGINTSKFTFYRYLGVLEERLTLPYIVLPAFFTFHIQSSSTFSFLHTMYNILILYMIFLT